MKAGYKLTFLIYIVVIFLKKEIPLASPTIYILAHTSNPSTEEPEVGEEAVGQLGLQSETVCTTERAGDINLTK